MQVWVVITAGSFGDVERYSGVYASVKAAKAGYAKSIERKRVAWREFVHPDGSVTYYTGPNEVYASDAAQIVAATVQE